MKVVGIILAAGSGTRMNSTSKKQFIELDKKPLIAHSLIAFQECDLVNSIIVVTQLEDIDKVNEICRIFGISKLDSVIPGGNTRSASSLCGVENAINYDVIAIHDAARPFISQDDLEKIIKSGIKNKASVLAKPIYDTVANINIDYDNNILFNRVLDRNNLVTIQTPQVFHRDIITQALKYVQKQNITVTDDASAVRELGEHVHIEFGSSMNTKITKMEDTIK